MHDHNNSNDSKNNGFIVIVIFCCVLANAGSEYYRAFLGTISDSLSLFDANLNSCAHIFRCTATKRPEHQSRSLTYRMYNFLKEL